MTNPLGIEVRSFLSALAVGLTFYAYVPYLKGIRTGKVQPHVFSWIIWGVTTCIVFFAQLVGKGGIGTVPIAISGFTTLLVALYAYQKRGEIKITNSDWFFFLLAFSSLPFWFYFSSPLAAVLVLSFADSLGFIPTIRKGYVLPHSEPLGFYLIFLFRNTLAILALAEWNLTTTLFPGSAGIACLVFVFVVKYRQNKI
ncbi:hypothetical protein [Leptospira levettii]|uniref:hypothetical protein n=1 Tax=Leptospira levettii TaxID=2023178 RepID=UPI0010826D50|nr:hypothetical protein [Leptospira levettii]MCW7508272.1 hypothetical protein [Leptospira levettii]MCW7519362.1 hypothetical protein [Leptospira levettii]TGK98320.1 hypothetical protein EHQ34_08510 [Leptospira levettii]TGL18153.1 hypothetical protein EHQ42_07160 [Leptospira levettii]